MDYLGVSSSSCIPKTLDGLFLGNSQSTMDDDDQGTPILGNVHMDTNGIYQPQIEMYWDKTMGTYLNSKYLTATGMMVWFRETFRLDSFS